MKRFMVTTPEPTDPDMKNIEWRLSATFEVDDKGIITKAPYVQQVGRPWAYELRYFERRGYEIEEV